MRQALQETLRTHNPGLSLLTLVGVAGLLVKRGREEQALELLALVMNHRASWQKAKDDAAPLMARLETELPANDVLAVKQRGHALDLDATVAELLAELQPAARAQG